MNVTDHMESALRGIAACRQSDIAWSEDQVRQGIVLPLLNALGYNVFDPKILVSDFSTAPERKKSERADLAVMDGDAPRFLIKLRSGDAALDGRHLLSMSAEFAMSGAAFVIMANSRFVRFYGEFDQPGVIDMTPLVELDLGAESPVFSPVLLHLSRESFDLRRLAQLNEEVRIIPALEARLLSALSAPPAGFVQSLLADIVGAEPDEALIARATGLVASCFDRLVAKSVRARIERALEDPSPALPEAQDTSTAENDGTSEEDQRIAQDEQQGLFLVRALVHDLCDTADIDLRPNQSYAAVLFKDNNRRTIARLHFKRAKLYLGLLEGDKETRHPLESVQQIAAFATQLRKAVLVQLEAEDSKPLTTSDRKSSPSVTTSSEESRTAEQDPGIPAQDERVSSAPNVEQSPPEQSDDVVELTAETELDQETQSLTVMTVVDEAPEHSSEAGPEQAPELTDTDFDEVLDSVAAEIAAGGVAAENLIDDDDAGLVAAQ